MHPVWREWEPLQYLRMFKWNDDLCLSGTDLFFDSRSARSLCFVSHAHSDHIPREGAHETAIATAETAALAEYRIGMATSRQVRYRTSIDLDNDTRLKLLPAGHVLGSA